MRLIDVDTLKYAMYHEAFETDTKIQKWDSGRWIRDKMFGNAVENAPTIEPERKKGKWIDLPTDWCECSACHKYWVPAGDEYDFNYCPGCGADMRWEG